MVFTENKPSTEPFSFIFLKKLCSFALVVMLIYYICNQFLQFHSSIVNPNLNFYRQNFNKSIGGSNDVNIIGRICSSSSIVNCTYNNGECKLDETVDHQSIPNCNHYAFNSQEKAEIRITPYITEIYLDGLVIDNQYYPSKESFNNKTNPLLIVNEQINVLYYTFMISNCIITSYVYGLVGGEKEEFVDFFAYTDHIMDLKTMDATTLILMPMSMDINYEEESYYDLGSIISNVGGFFSSLSGIFVFLFGATKLAPWGFLQTHVFSCLCTKYQRKLTRKLKNKYEPIPFVSGRTKNVTLEERVQNIENILKEYYLDTDFLNLLLTKYNKIDNNNIDYEV
ncbi:hypothetical protein RclHR1_09500005 [Rhizophagus clarus]|uniref:Uncharacterized protein n=1 Tax=Rhizophagus clarus TaxID=94130 RepID=A0A2Z6SQC7_9GLOM|nr:hypothetical protein RclHR1_09500005 [Rhizophagus clarus]GES98416.1 hypothetical protein GLOIN_2v1786427 [Rhizophagus clarus]